MKPQRYLVVLLVSIFALSLGSLHTAHAATAWGGLTDYTIQVGGYQRTYHVHVPTSYTGTTPLPLVVALHGSQDTGAGMAALTSFNNVADRYGLIAAYPDALNGTWNGTGTLPQDDVAFISAVIQAVSKTYTVNVHRVYAMGFSNGAGMTEVLGCRMSSQLAGIASVSGHMGSTLSCTLAHPMPYLSFHGTADPIWSYAGWGKTQYGNHLMGAIDAENKWAALDGCTGAPVVTNLPNVVPSDGTTEQLRQMTGCPGNTQAELYTIINGGHTWPGGPQYAPVSSIGLTCLDINASTLIWQFFAQFQN